MRDPDKKNTKILTDSEGLKVSRVHEDEDAEDESLNKGAKEAFEAEVAADAAAAEEEAKKEEEFASFLADR